MDMNHKPEDVKAAEEYAKPYHSVDKLGTHTHMMKAFLAGCEHKQKDIDELVEGIRYAKRIDDNFDAYNLSPGTRDLFERLIQKHKR